MNAHLPKNVSQSDLVDSLSTGTVARIHSGKVRDSFTIPGHPDKMLVLATDRISIFDFVLNALVPQKGEVLTAMTVFWLTEVLSGIAHHLLAYGSGIDQFLPKALQRNTVLQRRALVVKKLVMFPHELIVRGHLTGSGWRTYCKTKQICGISLPNGLHDGSQLPNPIFTPTTKVLVGHDEDILANSIPQNFRLLALHLFSQATTYASERGIIIADTKFEVGMNTVVADEVLTPDSSRFWLQSEWAAAVKQQHSPSGLDKEPVRDWGRQVETTITASGEPIIGIDHFNPSVADELAFVDKLEVPVSVLEHTAARYQNIFKMLTGFDLGLFQEIRMGIQG